MKLFSVAALCALVGLIALPALAQQKVVPAQSEIGFVTRQMGVPVDGKFRKFDAQVMFDPKQPAAAKIGFTIDLVSASIGTAETEAELVKPDWFDTKKFPQATFTSTVVKPTGAGKFDVAGTLSIKGSSQAVVVPVMLVQTGAMTTATGAFTLKRLDFKIGAGDWGDTSIVANDVQVKFKLTLTGVGAL
ncbi:MAG: YceI family protein [Burkholderiaceae bacterium]|nr:YceI family protein [Burkholderiaceae bacterium]